MLKKYYPKQNENRMKNVGGVELARKIFFEGNNRILYNLIKQRFDWMNKYIYDSDKNIIELGCGSGLSKEFINNKNLILTDIKKNYWVDDIQDAMNLTYLDETLDVIICSHMIHHIAKPYTFIKSLSNKLKHGGRIIIQDIYTSLIMKTVLRIMKHEGWDDTINVYDDNLICTDPNDAWSANCSIPKLLFFNKEFIEKFKEFKIIKLEKNECFLFLTSGGVIAKTYHLPLGDFGAKVISRIDNIIVKLVPSIFACGCSVVLEKK